MFLKKSSSEKLKSTVKNVITVNAYAGKNYIHKGDTFHSLNKLSYNTSNFITSYISNKDIISTTVQLSRSIPENDIPDILEIKAYEELGLDQASSYMISYTEVENAGEEKEYHIFVAQPEVLDELFSPIRQQTKYIDLIIPSPLLYKALYKKEILSDNGIHCFVYFTKQDAFVTFYKNGEFLYSKSIEFSLNQIYDKYCELIGEKVDEKEFFSTLESEGLKTTNSDYQQNLMKIFGEIFITINDIVIYTKRAFQLENIDQMFIGSVQGPIIGLDEYSQNYLGLQSSELNFNYQINNDEWYIDQLQFLMLLNSFEFMENASSTVNLTLFPRPPAFLNRAGGQFIVATAAAVSLGLAYPLVYLVGSYIDEAKISLLNNENNKLVLESNKYKKIFSDKKQKIMLLDKEVAQLSNLYQGKSKTLISIYNKKVHYKLKSGIFHTIAKELSKFDVNVDMMYSRENTLSISLVSSDDRKLTELIKYISEKHFDEINQIDIERIQKDSENNYYKGLLKVDLR